MNEQISIIIDSIFNSQGFKDATSQLEQLSAGVKGTSTQLQGFNDIVSIGRQAKQIATVNKYLDQFDTKLHATGRIAQKANGTLRATDEQLKNITNSVARGEWDDFNKGMKDGSRAAKEAGKGFASFSKQFAAEFLSVMFFGMQIRMQFEKLAKTTMDTFMRITEAMHPTAQAVNALRANMELLKFTIGSAVAGVLEALLPVLIPIINRFSDWVEQNKDLVGWIVILAIVFGTALFAIGMMFTGIQGIVMVLAKMGAGIGMLLSKMLGLKTVVGLWAFISTAGFAAVASIIGVVIAVVVLLYAMWKTNLGGIQEFTKGQLGIIWSLFKAVFGDLWKIVKDAFGIILAIFEGDWAKVWELTKLMGSRLFGLLMKLVAGIGMLLINVLSFLWNVIRDLLVIIVKGLLWLSHKWSDVWLGMGEFITEKAIVPAVNKAIDVLNGFIRGLRSLSGGLIDIGEISPINARDVTSAFSQVRNELDKQHSNIDETVDKWSENLTSGYFDKNNMDRVNAWVDENNQFLQQYEAQQLELKSMVSANEEIVDEQQSFVDKFANLFGNEEGGNAVDNVLSKMMPMFTELQSATVELEETSTSITEQNYLEAESWEMKMTTMERYMETVARYNEQMGNPNYDIELDRSTSNASTINL